jgi:glycosyltransferase involved in cell wall biosynthesis
LAREITESGCGAVIAPGDTPALLAALERWKNEPALIAEMSRNALKRAALYQRDNVLGTYEAELKALVDPLAPAVPQREIATGATAHASATMVGGKS